MFVSYRYSPFDQKLHGTSLDLEVCQQFTVIDLETLGSIESVECDLACFSYRYIFVYDGLPDYAHALLHPLVLTRWHASPTHFTKRESWNNYQLIYTHHGAGVLVWKNKVFHLSADSLCLLDCNQYHYFYANDADGWDYSYIHFTGNSMDTLFDLVEQRGLLYADLKGNSLQRTYDTIVELAKNNVDDFLLLFHRYMTILLTKLAASSSPPLEQTIPPYLVKLQTYIIEHFNEPLTAAELAASVCLSPSWFAHIFKCAFGLPPLEFQHRLRIEHAKEMLQNPELSIEEISERVGFSTVSSFYKKFHQLTGMPPGRYRKNLLD